jgi:hypothetical protein
MNERSQSTKERGSRVNFDQHSSAKTVREELASRKQQPKNGKLSKKYIRKSREKEEEAIVRH